MQAALNTTTLALDVGERRIGVAVASSITHVARPLTTLLQSDHIIEDIEQIVKTEAVEALVVGLPRGLDGQETQQTQSVRKFVARLHGHITVPTFWQDEALTSVQAEAELSQRKGSSTKADIDALAATYILEDFLRDPAGADHV
jgi:putative Holliday junction resolvase